jgi:hypothetical protein
MYSDLRGFVTGLAVKGSLSARAGQTAQIAHLDILGA